MIQGDGVGVKYRKSMDMNDLAEGKCCSDERFFAKVQTMPNDSTSQVWLVREDGHYLPALHPTTQQWLFEEVTWVCGKDPVTYCKTPNMDDADALIGQVEPGFPIYALPVPSTPGWLQEAGSKMYLPMHCSTTGAPLFTSSSAPATVPKQMGMSKLISLRFGWLKDPLEEPPKAAGVPKEAVWVHETYSGPMTIAAGCVGCSMCCGVPGCIICYLGVDERDVWKSPDGKTWNWDGTLVAG